MQRTKYLVNIPLYFTNKGRGDNHNGILKHYEDTRVDAETVKDKLIQIFNKEDELSEDEYEYLQSIIDWEGYIIKEPYVTVITETRI